MLAVVCHAIYVDGLILGNMIGGGLAILCIAGLVIQRSSHHLALAGLYIVLLLSIGIVESYALNN